MLVILLLVYRSVLLPLVIILGAVFALGLACTVVYALADDGVVRVDGQVQGILSILVIGAATDYALLLTARFREELATRTDRFAAVRAALRQSWGAIVASAATVTLGLLALLLSDLTNNRALGPVALNFLATLGVSALVFLHVFGFVREGEVAAVEEPVHVAVHDVPRAHPDQRYAEQIVHGHRRRGRRRAVRTDHHHRAAPQQFGGLELGGHVVAVEVVDEPEVEGVPQQAPVDVGLLGADHLDLGEGMRGAEVTGHRDEQRHGHRVDRAQPDRPG